MTGPHYLYGILREAEAGAVAAAPPGIGGGAVIAVPAAGLAVLCGAAPEPGPVARTRRNLLCHTAVLEAASRSATVLPLRFGTVAPDAASAARCLASNRNAFASALADLDGKVELGVKASWAAGEAGEAVLRAEPALRALRDRLRARPEAETYFERIELGRRVETAIGALRLAETLRLTAPLQALAHRHLALSHLDESMIFNLAFLVAREREAAFDDAVEALGARAGAGVSVRYVGPVPAFNFVDLRADWSARDRAA